MGSDNKGWECPKCGRVYAPSVTECFACNALVVQPIMPGINPWYPPERQTANQVLEISGNARGMEPAYESNENY